MGQWSYAFVTTNVIQWVLLITVDSLCGFEMGRTELLRATGWTYRQFEEEGVFLAVIDLAIKYRKPARYDDLLTLHTFIEGGSRVKIKHNYQLKRGEDLLATGRSTPCLSDAQRRSATNSRFAYEADHSDRSKTVFSIS